MFERFKQLFNTPVEKQIDSNSPFSIIQNNFSELFGLSAKGNFLSAYRSWVFACVNAIAVEIADIDLKLMKRNGDDEPEEIREHPVIDLLRKVNPRMTMHQLFETTQSYLELDGNAFWFLARENEGEGDIGEIWALKPDRVSIIQDKENPLLVSRYIYKQKDGTKIPFEEKDVIHFANFNAQADYPFPSRGMGTVEAAITAIDTNSLAQEWNKLFFLNSARPDFILKAPSAITPADYERLKRKFEAGQGGVKNAHKFLLLQNGLELDKLTASQKDMDFVNQVTQTRDEILAIFRVPKTVLGITDDVNRANAEATNFVFALRTIDPKMQRIVDILNEFLLPNFDETGELYFDYTSPVPENEEVKLLEYEKGMDKWLTRNEIRAREGLLPSKDGDMFFGQLSQIPIDEVEQAKEIPKATAKKPKNTDEAIKFATEEHINKLFPKVVKEITNGRKNLSTSRIERFGEMWVKGVEENEKIFEKKMEKFLTGQESRVINSLKDSLKGLKEKEYILKQADALLPDEDDEITALIDFMDSEYKRIVEDAGNSANDLVGSDDIFDVSNPRVTEFLKERSKFFSESVNDTTFQSLERSLDEGLEAGEGIEELASRVREIYKNRNAERIARTETSASSNFANQEAYRQNGVPLKKWVNFGPLDSDCVIPAGQEPIPINAEFNNGLQIPPVHPNCLCIIVPIFE